MVNTNCSETEWYKQTYSNNMQKTMHQNHPNQRTIGYIDIVPFTRAFYILLSCASTKPIFGDLDRSEPALPFLDSHDAPTQRFCVMVSFQSIGRIWNGTFHETKITSCTFVRKTNVLAPGNKNQIPCHDTKVYKSMGGKYNPHLSWVYSLSQE